LTEPPQAVGSVGKIKRPNKPKNVISVSNNSPERSFSIPKFPYSYILIYYPTKVVKFFFLLLKFCHRDDEKVPGGGEGGFRKSGGLGS